MEYYVMFSDWRDRIITKYFATSGNERYDKTACDRATYSYALGIIKKERDKAINRGLRPLRGQYTIQCIYNVTQCYIVYPYEKYGQKY